MAKPRRAKAVAAATSSGWSSWIAMRLLGTIYRPAVLLPLALIGAGLVLTPYLSAWIPSLNGRPEYVTSVEAIRISPPNRWVPDDFVERTVRTAGYTTELSLLDEKLVHRLGQAFAADPWVKELQRIRMHRDGRIEVELTYRHPVLMVQAGTGTYAVDVDGVLLPPGDFSPEETVQFPLAVNARSLPQGAAGRAWGDPAIVGAAQLASILAPEQDLSRHWTPLHLRAIHIPTPTTATRDLKSIDYELLTTGGSRILWGRVPGADDLEPPASTKLQKLEFYLSQYGQYEQPNGVCQIDVRPFDVVSSRPLDASRMR
ncbi:MAG: hypothetical protein R3C01_09065 [Planctomycetaceae bacterium]